VRSHDQTWASVDSVRVNSSWYIYLPLYFDGSRQEVELHQPSSKWGRDNFGDEGERGESKRER